ncbi:MAG: hypothetical protein Q9170_000166 [Blastenia crenularia]
MLDGYEELPDDLQEKVKLALENGHVADEDWKGDLEQNRPGKRGFRSPAPKKSKKSKKAVEEEGSGEESGDKTPSKPAPKKRGLAKKEYSEGDDAEEPAKKKAKATTNKGRKIMKEENADMKSELHEATKPKSKAVTKKSKVAKTEEAEEAQETLEEVNTAVTAPKRATAAEKKGKKFSGDKDLEAASADSAHVQPRRAAGRPCKAKVEDFGNQSPAGEFDDPSSGSTKKARTTKNAANTKKRIANKAEDKASADATEGPSGETTKVKRGRKKANDTKAKST